MPEQNFDREVDPQQQVRRMLGVVRRGWLAIATCLGAGVLIGVALWFFLPKTYVSTGKLMMRSAWLFEPFGDQRSMDELPFSARARQLEDELRSTLFVKTVLDKLEWPDWIRAQRAGELEERRFLARVKDKITCRVTPGETGERLAFVTFAWTERQRASEFCKELISYWQDSARDGYLQGLDQRLAIADESLKSKQGELEDSQRQLEQFEVRHGISAINQKQDTQQRHDKLRIDLDALSGDIASVYAKIEQIDHDLSATDATGALLTPPSLPESSTLTNDEKNLALAQVNQIVQQINVLKLRGFSDRWPQLMQLKGELKRLMIMTSELQNTVTVPTKPLPNPAWEIKKGERDALYVDLQGMTARKGKMEADIKELEDALQTLPEVLRLHETYRQEVTTRAQIVQQQMLDLTPLKDKKQALSRKGGDALIAFQQIEKPVPAPSPSSAIGWLALAISTMVGFGLAMIVVIGKELLRSSFASADQARQALKLPVLGEVAPIQTALEVRRARFVRALQIAASLTLLAGISASIWICVARPGELPRWLVDWAQGLREALS